MPLGAEIQNEKSSNSDKRSNASRLLATARELVNIAGGLDGSDMPVHDTCLDDTSQNAQFKTFIARSFYSDRRLRDEIFKHPDLFGEPAWDMLLDLYISYREGKSVSVTSACIAAAVPATTGLRCVGKLEDLGLIRRSADKRDGRRALLSLTDQAITLLELYLTECSMNRLQKLPDA